MRLSRFLPLALVAASFAAVPATAQVFYKPPAFAAKPIMALEPGFDPAIAKGADDGSFRGTATASLPGDGRVEPAHDEQRPG